MSAKPNINDIMIYVPIFPGEIIVAKKESININNTKIDDMGAYMPCNLPKFSKKEKMEHYSKKLQLVWEGKLCLQ